MIFTTTPRLHIRAFKHDDAPALLDYLASPAAPCFQDEKLRSLVEAERDVAKRAADASQFAVCLQQSDRLIGHLFAENRDEHDRNTWSVGWHFNPRYGGQGYATEAVAALFAFLFTEKAARRLYAWVEDYNVASQKLCHRLGMRQEGCFREFVSFTSADGEERYDNTLVFALLKKEWEAVA